jgi:hypothetical protein
MSRSETNFRALLAQEEVKMKSKIVRPNSSDVNKKNKSGKNSSVFTYEGKEEPSEILKIKTKVREQFEH